jgi:phosphoribosyl 1,2-cyclic phosphodiesterase
MSMRLCVLGSGSAGNCSLLILDHGSQRRFVLIDLGLSPRATAKRLKPLDLALANIEAVLLTHLDGDHFHSGWHRWIARLNIPILVHRRHRSVALGAGLSLKHVSMFNGSVRCDWCQQIDTVLLAHDQLGSTGFVFQHRGVRLGFATDLGCAPEALFELFTDLHGLAIESNYDREMQLRSGRPAFLKRRIMGGMGHLSNEQSLEAVQRVAAQSTLSHIALLHLSRQCNDPALIEQLYRQQARTLWPQVTITNQLQPTAMLEVEDAARRSTAPGASRSGQLALFADEAGRSPSEPCFSRCNGCFLGEPCVSAIYGKKS